MNQEEIPAFFKIGNIYLVISGWVLIMVANLTPFVYGTFLNLYGMITYPLGIITLYLNYRIVKNKTKSHRGNVE